MRVTLAIELEFRVTSRSVEELEALLDKNRVEQS
jgi:hypothetical protein